MNSNVKLLLAGLCFACAPAFAALTFVTTPAGLGSNDSTNWGQLGEDQTVLSGGFTATSALSVGVTGSFSAADNTGLVADVCLDGDGSCTWGPTAGGMQPGDTDIFAFDNGTSLGTGPITLAFGTALIGGGAWIQGDTAGVYTAQIQAFNGGTSLGSFTSTSDASGDPIFIGVLQSPSVANITSIVFSLTSCAGCSNLGDFAIDTLLMTDQTSTSSTPEPSSVALLGTGLAGMAWMLRKRSLKNDRRS